MGGGERGGAREQRVYIAGVEACSYVYLMASRRNGTLYTSVTTNLLRRVWEHSEGVTKGFTKTYAVNRLVWFEPHASIHDAIAREKAIKRWRRAWKLALIERENPLWRDLYEDMC